MPDDAAEEKSLDIQEYGAQVSRVRPVSISHQGAGQAKIGAQKTMDMDMLQSSSQY
jgi:cysteine synthase